MKGKIKCKAVFFDLWDTLVSSFSITSRTKKIMGFERKSFKYFIRRFEKATMLKTFDSYEEFFAAAFSALSAKPEKETIKELTLLWRKNLANTKPFPETMPVLQSLKKKGFKLAIISNCQCFEMRKTINRFGFEKIFDSILLSFEAHSLKPEPLMFRRALKELKLKPKEAIMVGDADTDIKGAEKAGVRGILIDRKGKRKNSHKTVARIKSLEELEELLDSVNN